MKRAVIGLIEGLVVGGLVAALVMRLFPDSSALAAYLGALFTGAGAGLVAGKPIWAKEAKLEALLKSFVGAFIAATALFGARKWLGGVQVDVGRFGSGAIGSVPVVVLPILGVALAWVFEIDHAVGPEVSAPPERRRVSASGEDDVDIGAREQAEDVEKRRHQS
jgi:hypothetical protein